MLVNRKELARRVAITGGYAQGDMEEVLKILEDVIVEAIKNGDIVKQGKLYKLFLNELPRKECWDNFSGKYVTREPKRVPKFQLLSRLESIELPVKEEK